MGISLSTESRIIVTGGASVNTAILQVIADVMNRPVYTQPIPNSAALGGAYRARYSSLRDISGAGTYAEMVQPVSRTAKLVCWPREGAEEVYEGMCKRLRVLQVRAQEMMKEEKEMGKGNTAGKMGKRAIVDNMDQESVYKDKQIVGR